MGGSEGAERKVVCDAKESPLVKSGSMTTQQWIARSSAETACRARATADCWLRMCMCTACAHVADGAVGGLPHLLEVKLLDARLVRRDGGALDADAALLWSWWVVRVLARVRGAERGR